MLGPVDDGSRAALKTLATRIQQEVFGAGRTELIDELYCERLAPGIKALVAMIRGGFPDLQIRIDHLLAEDDKVACAWTATGTHAGFFYNIPPTEAQATWTGVSIYLVGADGRVERMAGNWDMFGLMRQLRKALAQRT
jgi:predicted ester cyclase